MPVISARYWRVRSDNQISRPAKVVDAAQACDVDQKERGFDAMALRKMLIGADTVEISFPPAEDLERTLLCFAADRVNDSIRIRISSSKRWVR
jgi:hypothetical protein